MNCPRCDRESTKVVDSRPSTDGKSVRRRRECRACDARFTTYERIEQRVRKLSGRVEDFRPRKLRASIATACAKRPVSEHGIDLMVARIVEEVTASAGAEIPTHLIGEAAMRTLEPVDRVAFIRYASVYRNFQDIGEFVDAVDALGFRSEASALGHSDLSQRELELEPGDGGGGGGEGSRVRTGAAGGEGEPGTGEAGG